MANPLEEAVRAFQRAQAAAVAAEQRAVNAKEQVRVARTRLADAIVQAARDGMRQVDIIKATGYSRERVRTILRVGGIEPDD